MLEKVQGETPSDRAKSLARLRDREGHMADFEIEPAPRIIERHHPMQALFDAFPEAAAMERDLFQRVLGVAVRREQRQAGGTYEYVFSLVVPADLKLLKLSGNVEIAVSAGRIVSKHIATAASSS